MVPLGDELTSACRAAALSVRLSPTTPCAVTSTILAPGYANHSGATLPVIATWPGKRAESNTTLGKFAAIFHAFPVGFEFVTVLAWKLSFVAPESIWTAELE